MIAALFYFLWIVAFSMAATQFVLIVAVASWYFTENQEIIADTNARLLNNKKNISVEAEKIS